MNKRILMITGGAIITGVIVSGAGAYYFFLKQKKAPATVSTIVKTTQSVSQNTVEIEDFTFNPKIMTVQAGTVVTFTNRDIAAHTATANEGSFDTGLLRKDQSGTVTFDKPGTYSYHCTPHAAMKGTVVVE